MGRRRRGVRLNITQVATCNIFFRFHSLDVRLVDRGEDGVDGHGGRGQVEVVEEHRQVVVEAPRRPKPDVERAAGHALDRPGRRACDATKKKIKSQTEKIRINVDCCNSSENP